MNSDQSPVEELVEGQEKATSTSSVGGSDTNANVSNQRKGAIPKTKPLKETSAVNKVKQNNNNEVVGNGFLDKTSQPVSTLDCDSDHGNSLFDFLLNKPGTSSKDVVEGSSSDENELLSISDDGCIYTYKADDAADLPKSFFNLTMGQAPEAPPPERETVSPEMDFLEMDFDPGPCGDAESGSHSVAEGEIIENVPQVVNCSAEIVTEVNESKNCEIKAPIRCENTEAAVTTPPVEDLRTSVIPESQPLLNIAQPAQMPWSCTYKQRTSTTSNNYVRLTTCHHSGVGELSEAPTREDYICDKKLQQVMIWSEEEACNKQVTQIAASACGATAVLNVLNALRFPVPSIEKVQNVVQTRLRANSGTLAEYLASRSFAGSTHDDMISALTTLSGDQIHSRFFHMYPERVLNLNWWLQYWISQGAVPIATLNLQKCVGVIPDAWHHQMIFGVGPCGVYLTNPLECIKPELLWPQLSSESILLVRREDVLNRWNTNPSLNQLMGIRDRRWTSINVVGQVANMVRESHREFRPGFTSTAHIKIPAIYSSGITLSVLKTSPAFQILKQCPELPFLPTSPDITSTTIF